MKIEYLAVRKATFVYSLKAVFNNRGMQTNTHVCDCVCVAIT